MLEQVDLNQTLEKDAYKEELALRQAQLRLLGYQLYREKRLLVIVYEGWDAAGKGGNIKRVTEQLDPRGYEVFSIAKPSDADAQHHYLWRFWRRLLPPDEKQVLIFDRSWYGRVLVERVEGFATEAEWQRAYDEINSFERQLSDSGAIVVKFWLHISPEEQLRRFQDRQQDPYRTWKLTDEDWRNREKWSAYAQAVEDMLAKTSPPDAPWTVIAGNDKRFARVQTLRVLVDTVAKRLNYKFPKK